jgi:hypothetical protein
MVKHPTSRPGIPERRIRAKTSEMGKGTAKGRQKLSAAEAKENIRWYRQRALLKFGASASEVGPLLPMPEKLAARIDAIHKRVEASPELTARKNELRKLRRGR